MHEFLAKVVTLLVTEHRTGLVLVDAEFLATTFLLCIDNPSSLSIILMHSVFWRVTYGLSSAVSRS